MLHYPRPAPAQPIPWQPVALPMLQYLATAQGKQLKDSPYVFAYHGMLWGGRGRCIRIRGNQLKDAEFDQVLDMDGTLKDCRKERDARRSSAKARQTREHSRAEEAEAVRRNAVLQAKKAEMEMRMIQTYPPGHPWAGHPMPSDGAASFPGVAPLPPSPMDSAGAATGPPPPHLQGPVAYPAGPVAAPPDPAALAAHFQVPPGVHPANTAPPQYAAPPPQAYAPPQAAPPQPASVEALLHSVLLSQQRQTEAIDRLAIILEMREPPPATQPNPELDACGICGKAVPPNKDPARWIPRHKQAAHTGKLAIARQAKQGAPAAT